MSTLVDIDIHPDLDSPGFRDLVLPSRPLWTASQLRALTGAVAAQQGAQLAAVARYTEPDRWWTRLALTRGVEVWLLTWLPGQGTRPHDHGGAAGSFTVVTGAVTEQHRYPGGPIISRTFLAGHGIGFGGDHAHLVTNTADAPAATVHAYSPPLLPTRQYRSLEEIQ